MDFMVKLAIFANKGTSEKVLLPVPEDQIGEAMTRLNKQFDGNWVFVDQLKGGGEMIKFDDGVEYLGFDGEFERYSAAIIKLKK